MRHPILLILIALCFGNAEAQKHSYTDGPYIEYVQDSVEITWIKNGSLGHEVVDKDEAYTFSVDGLPEFSLADLQIDYDTKTEYSDVEKFVALSDIHGQFDIFRRLLLANRVVDSDGNWIYDRGHLVIVGDMLDRGDEVLKVLWFLYDLEKKAAKKGGKVHVLLGNHELMVIDGQLGYLHQKYRYTSGITQKPYDKFFGSATFLGHWLRSKKIAVSINDVVFVHGGFSPELLQLDKSIKELNDIFSSQILHAPQREHILKDPLLKLLYFENGPLWHRGNAQPYAFDTDKAKVLLRTLHKKTLVIGHTSMPNVMGLYSNRIILVDSSIKFGKTGELLIYEDGQFFRGTIDGVKLPLIPENETDNAPSIVQQLITQQRIIIYLHFRSVSHPLNYKSLEGLVLASIYFDTYGLDFTGRLKVREKSEKRKCKTRKFEIELDIDQLENFGFSSDNEMVIDLPCEVNNFGNEVWAGERIGQLNLEMPEGGYKKIKLILRDGEKMAADMNAVLVGSE